MSHAEMLMKPAVFSPDRLYRYTLRRDWLAYGEKKMVAFIGLNPSTADEVKSDPTVTRCINYAKHWGFGGMFMLNIFGWRSTDPKALYTLEDPIGPFNDEYIMRVAQAEEVKLIVCCWGNHGGFMGRGWEVMQRLQEAGKKIYRLGTFTDQGQPRHPLYLRGDLKPELI